MGSFLSTAAPFILAFLIEATSPLTTFFWKKRMRLEAGDIGKTGDPEKLIDVLSHAIDTVRMLTTSLLTVVSGLIALNPPVEYIVWVFAVVTLLVFLVLLKYQRSYSKYVTKGYFGYSPASIFIIAVNLIFIGAVWISINCPSLLSS